MASIIENLIYFYNQFDNLADPTVKKWFLMNSLLYPISILGVYLYFIFLLGPKMMKNLKPFNINKFIIFYNIIQVIFNAYLCRHTIQYFWDNLNHFRCFKMSYLTPEEAYWARIVNWLFVINKMLDLLDTVFFVLKKKQSHVTFLHVYHHIMTFFLGWSAAKYSPGGQQVVIGVLNSFVHTVMYSYYLLSLFDRFKFITSIIKKRITQMQITQFIIAGVHIIYGFTDPDCDFPAILVYVGTFQTIVFIILFTNFYRKAYIKRNNPEYKKAQNGHIQNGFANKVD
uniref:Elongation of very long chain fatty acids protein n=1 Tax=Phenacoccus solenopsis TaxID=483260 RepID=A0A411AR51_9HEMI|nr:elongase of very long chain fatty acid [Phenacoccus solenopsis]